MDEKRMGEIALAIEKMRLRKNGTSSLNPSDARREFGNIAKAIGIPIKEVMAFYKQLLEEAMTEIFADPK